MNSSGDSESRSLLDSLLLQRGWNDAELSRRMQQAGAELGLSVTGTERTIRRWRRGEIRHPAAATRRVLEQLFDQPVALLLSPAPIAENDTELSPLHNPLREMITNAATDTRRITTWLETSGGVDVVDMYRDALMALSEDFVHRPAGEIFEDLTALRTEIFDDLQQRRYPRRDLDLLTLTGMASLVLAHAAHVLGHSAEGMSHARLARLCARESGQIELGAWACGTQALLAEGADRLREAHNYIQTAREQLAHSRLPGSAELRLAYYEARIATRMNPDSTAVLSALHAAEEVRERLRGATDVAELDDIGGILTFPAAKADMYAGHIHILAGQPAIAERYALAAINGYRDGRPEQLSYGDLALTHVDLATARVADGNVTGAQRALTPVLALPESMRITPLRTALSTLSATLSEPQVRGALGSIDLRDSIQSFTSTPEDH